jgi:hypothetical protein
VASTWRARCLCHAGDIGQAERVWDRLGDGEEVRFFRAEGLYLKGKVHAESERAKSEKVAHQHGGGREVVDDIQVVH